MRGVFLLDGGRAGGAAGVGLGATSSIRGAGARRGGGPPWADTSPPLLGGAAAPFSTATTAPCRASKAMDRRWSLGSPDMASWRRRASWGTVIWVLRVDLQPRDLSEATTIISTFMTAAPSYPGRAGNASIPLNGRRLPPSSGVRFPLRPVASGPRFGSHGLSQGTRRRTVRP